MNRARRLFGLLALGTVIGRTLSPAKATTLVTSSNNGLSYDGTTTSVLSVVGRLSNVSITPGLIALGTTDVIVTATGVLAGDTVLVNLASGATLAVGVVMSGATATANNQVTIRFACPLVLGVTLGTFAVNIAWLR